MDQVPARPRTPWRDAWAGARATQGVQPSRRPSPHLPQVERPPRESHRQRCAVCPRPREHRGDRKPARRIAQGRPPLTRCSQQGKRGIPPRNPGPRPTGLPQTPPNAQPHLEMKHAEFVRGVFGRVQNLAQHLLRGARPPERATLVSDGSLGSEDRATGGDEHGATSSNHCAFKPCADNSQRARQPAPQPRRAQAWAGMLRSGGACGRPSRRPAIFQKAARSTSRTSSTGIWSWEHSTSAMALSPRG